MLAVNKISFQRDQDAVLAPLGFELGTGELLFVIGGNGSGKTTLMRLLAGLLPPPSEATVHWHQQPWRAPEANGPVTLYLGHQLAIKDDLSCNENLTFYARFLGQRQAGLQTALQSVGLNGYEYTLARQLSAGQRKRLALARLLICPAELWLLDEPYSNLDSEGAVLVDRLLSRHLGEGGLAIVTSHGGYIPGVQSLRKMQLEAV